MQLDFLAAVFDRTSASRDAQRQRKRRYFPASLDTSGGPHHHIVTIIAAQTHAANAGEVAMLVREISDNRQALDQERTFKNAMRRLAGGVVVITAGRGEDISGMTVTSFSSLSAEPPAVVVSINRQSSSWPLIQRYCSFAANILGGDQIGIARQFTSQSGLNGPDRFHGAPWIVGETGTPLLADAPATFDCRLEGTIDYNSHVLLIASVLGVRLASETTGGLTYWSGQYRYVGDGLPGSDLTPERVPTARALREF